MYLSTYPPSIWWMGAAQSDGRAARRIDRPDEGNGEAKPASNSVSNSVSNSSLLPVGPEGEVVKKMICCIAPNVWLGKREAAQNLPLLKALNIGACCNTTDEQDIFPGKLLYLRLGVEDATDVDIVSLVPSVVLPWVQHHMLHTGVLIYCRAGVSRSCTVALAVLLHLRPEWTLLVAWQHVKRQRPQARPNRGFLQQLAKYEVALRGESSVHIDKKGRGFRPSLTLPTPPLQSTSII